MSLGLFLTLYQLSDTNVSSLWRHHDLNIWKQIYLNWILIQSSTRRPCQLLPICLYCRESTLGFSVRVGNLDRASAFYIQLSWYHLIYCFFSLFFTTKENTVCASKMWALFKEAYIGDPLFSVV